MTKEPLGVCESDCHATWDPHKKTRVCYSWRPVEASAPDLSDPFVAVRHENSVLRQPPVVRESDSVFASITSASAPVDLFPTALPTPLENRSFTNAPLNDPIAEEADESIARRKASAPAAPPERVVRVADLQELFLCAPQNPCECCKSLHTVIVEKGFMSAIPSTDAAPKDQTQAIECICLYGQYQWDPQEGKPEPSKFTEHASDCPIGMQEAAIEEAVRVVDRMTCKWCQDLNQFPLDGMLHKIPPHGYVSCETSKPCTKDGRAILDAILPILRSGK